jgi:uncharacterized heparinase superfamily protein
VINNPPFIGIGWQPYPTSLRIVNWIKWALSEQKISSDFLYSLLIQSRWLSRNLEYHLMGNHLFANAKALIFSGFFFDGYEADNFLKTGLKILDAELDEQVLEDGGHFERSTMYQAIVLEDVLDIYLISLENEHLIPKKMQDKLQKISCKMLKWLSIMSHPDGGITFFNDAAFEIAPTLNQLQHFADNIGISCINRLIHSSKLEVMNLDSSGYVVIASPNIYLALDLAPIGPSYLPGHAHADTLSFELSLFSSRIFVNGGTSCYGLSKQRSYERSTRGHNTVTINNESSSEVWSGFRVARRAKVYNTSITQSDKVISVTGVHDGYKRLPSDNTHSRVWNIFEKSVHICDYISGEYRSAVANFIIHPSLPIRKIEENIWSIFIPSGNEIFFKVLKGSLSIKSSTYAPNFGLILEAKCFCVELDGGESKVLVYWE